MRILVIALIMLISTMSLVGCGKSPAEDIDFREKLEENPIPEGTGPDAATHK